MKYLKLLYVQVIIGIIAGVAVGSIWPEFGSSLRPLGVAFINLIKVIIAPVIFCTVTSGIARMGDLGSLGRVGGKTMGYFLTVSSFALLVGLFVAFVFKPGAGWNVDPATLDPTAVESFVAGAADISIVDFLMNIIPHSFVSAFSENNLLQVLLVSILTGVALTRLGEFGDKAAFAIDQVARVFFSIIHIVVRFAPIGAFGAMAFTMGEYGWEAIGRLAWFVALFYLTAATFIVVVLGAISLWAGFNIFRFLWYIFEEILIVIGASSSESALPQLMEKLERLGAQRGVVGLVVPTGYSFNLDGTNIYMTLATLFLVQATNNDLSAMDIVTILSVAIITSKGAAGVAGAGFVTLAATLDVIPGMPVAALALIIGVDRFMSECRAITNFIGNGVAALVIAKWEGALDMETLRRELRNGPGRSEPERLEPAYDETGPD
jgi:aerobic C4-dicarboxylate transport protein